MSILCCSTVLTPLSHLEKKRQKEEVRSKPCPATVHGFCGVRLPAPSFPCCSLWPQIFMLAWSLAWAQPALGICSLAQNNRSTSLNLSSLLLPRLREVQFNKPWTQKSIVPHPLLYFDEEVCTSQRCSEIPGHTVFHSRERSDYVHNCYTAF